MVSIPEWAVWLIGIAGFFGFIILIILAKALWSMVHWRG